MDRRLIGELARQSASGAGVFFVLCVLMIAMSHPNISLWIVAFAAIVGAGCGTTAWSDVRVGVRPLPISMRVVARTVWFFSVVLPAAVIGICVFVSRATESVLSHTGPAIGAALAFGSVWFISTVLGSEESPGNDRVRRLVRGISTTIGGIALLFFVATDEWAAYPDGEAALAVAGPFLALGALWVASRCVAKGGSRTSGCVPGTQSRTVGFCGRLDVILSHPLGDAFRNSIRLTFQLALVAVLLLVVFTWVSEEFIPYGLIFVVTAVCYFGIITSKSWADSLRALRALPVSWLRLVAWFLLYFVVVFSLPAAGTAAVCLSGRLAISWGWVAVVNFTIFMIGICHLFAAFHLGHGDPLDVEVGCLTALGLFVGMSVAALLFVALFSWIATTTWSAAAVTGAIVSVVSAIWIGWLLRHSSAPFAPQKEQ